MVIAGCVPLLLLCDPSCAAATSLHPRPMSAARVRGIRDEEGARPSGSITPYRSVAPSASYCGAAGRRSGLLPHLTRSARKVWRREGGVGWGSEWETHCSHRVVTMATPAASHRETTHHAVKTTTIGQGTVHVLSNAKIGHL